MKKTLLTVLFIYATLIIYAQSPNLVSYQAVVRDAEGNLLKTHNIGIQLGIKQGSPEGPLVYSETQYPTTNANGLVSVEIGNGSAEGNFAAIDWSEGPYFITIEIDPSGGTDYTIVTTSQLLSVPYALHANTADSLLGGVSETDPAFTSWDKSTGISISESQISDLQDYLSSETDPVFISSVAGTITASDTTYWNNKLDNESQNLNNVLDKGNNGGGIPIKNIANPTHAQDAATKAYVDALLEQISELEVLSTRLEDADGNFYPLVKIGDQIWMAENLRTTKYNNGTSIPHVTDNTEWVSLKSPAYCWYSNDEASYKYPYGAFYNWFTVETGLVCPTGWHVPSSTEWGTLFTLLGGTSIAGGKLKEAGLAHWTTPNTGATNESGFFGLPAGSRSFTTGTFSSLSTSGTWWTTTLSETPGFANVRYISYNNITIGTGSNDQRSGCSVRCIKD